MSRYRQLWGTVGFEVYELTSGGFEAVPDTDDLVGVKGRGDTPALAVADYCETVHEQLDGTEGSA